MSEKTPLLSSQSPPSHHEPGFQLRTLSINYDIQEDPPMSSVGVWGDVEQGRLQRQHHRLYNAGGLQGPEDSFEPLPDEVLLHITAWLDFRDTAALRAVDRRWRAVSQGDAVFQAEFQRRLEKGRWYAELRGQAQRERAERTKKEHELWKKRKAEEDRVRKERGEGLTPEESERRRKIKLYTTAAVVVGITIALIVEVLVIVLVLPN